MDSDLVPSTCIATSILIVLLVVVTTVSNGILLYVLYKDPLKRFTKPVTTFITAIAIMDFLTGALCDTSQARFEIRCAMEMKTKTEFVLGGFTMIVGFFTVNSATLLILAMTVERFLAVGFPHFYRRAVTRKRANVCIIGVCVHCFVFALLQLAEVDLNIYQTVDLYLHTVFPIVSVMVMYTVIYLMLRRQRNKIREVCNKENGSNGRNIQKGSRNQTCNPNQKIERQVACTAFVITLLLVLAFLPYTVMIIAAAHCKNCISKEWFVVLNRVAVPFVFSNSAANPFVYVLRMRDLRKSIKMSLGWSQGKENIVAIEHPERNIVAVELRERNTGEGNDSSEIVTNQIN